MTTPPPDTGDIPAALRPLSPLDRLRLEPSRFSLDQAAAVIAPGQDPTTINFRTLARLGAPAGEVVQATPGVPGEREGGEHAGRQRPKDPVVLAATLGLIGAGGVLPRHFTTLIGIEDRNRSLALHAFIDTLSRRMVGLFVKAGSKYQPSRNGVLTEQLLSALVGLGTPHLSQALVTPLQSVLFHAGGLASRTRSAERLRGMLSEEAGCDVEIVEFVGGWMRVAESEQSRMASPGRTGQFVQLGVDASMGARAWDPCGRFLIRIGPLALHDFEALMPGAPLHARLVELTRLHVGLEQEFAFNPILAAGQVPPLQLGAGTAATARLGWNSWMTSPRPREVDANEAVLRPLTGA